MGLRPKLSLYSQANAGQYRSAGGARINDIGVKVRAEGSIGNAKLNVTGGFGSSYSVNGKLSYNIPLSENSGIQASAHVGLLQEVMPSNHYLRQEDPKILDINTASEQEIAAEISKLQDDPSLALKNSTSKISPVDYADSDLSYGIGAEYYHKTGKVTFTGGVRYEKSTEFDTPTDAPAGRQTREFVTTGLSVSYRPAKKFQIFGELSKPVVENGKFDFNMKKNIQGAVGVRVTIFGE